MLWTLGVVEGMILVSDAMWCYRSEVSEMDELQMSSAILYCGLICRFDGIFLTYLSVSWGSEVFDEAREIGL